MVEMDKWQLLYIIQNFTMLASTTFNQQTSLPGVMISIFQQSGLKKMSSIYLYPTMRYTISPFGSSDSMWLACSTAVWETRPGHWFNTASDGNTWLLGEATLASVILTTSPTKCWLVFKKIVPFYKLVLSCSRHLYLDGGTLAIQA